MSKNMKCPKCGEQLIVKGGRTGQAKAVAKSLLTLRIEQTYVCPKCGYTEKREILVQK